MTGEYISENNYQINVLFTRYEKLPMITKCDR